MTTGACCSPGFLQLRNSGAERPRPFPHSQEAKPSREHHSWLQSGHSIASTWQWLSQMTVMGDGAFVRDRPLPSNPPKVVLSSTVLSLG